MKRTKQKILILLLGVFLVVGLQLKAQETGPYHLLPAVSQSSFLNPAIQNETNKLVISVPFLSGTSLAYNPNFPLDALFSQGLWNYNFFDFYDNLPAFGEGQASMQFTMFYASLNYGEYTFSLALADRAHATTHFNREIIKLIRDGVEPYYNQDEDFGEGSVYFNHFRELSFGISQRYWKELDIGIRPKILFGRTYLDAQDINFSVETNEQENILHLRPEGSFNMAAPLTYTRDTVFEYTFFSPNIVPSDYSFNLRNIGFALDAGVVFRPNKFYEISASVLDLGFTGFKHNTFDIEFIDPVEYKMLYQSYDPEEPGYLESREALRAFSDSLSYIIAAEDQQNRIINVMPFKINVSGKYNVSETFSLGVSNKFSFYGEQSVNIFSGYIHKNFNRTDIGASVSAYNFSDFWIGLGVSYTADHFQYFISTENIFGIIQPAGTKRLNLSFGINLLFTMEKQ